MKPFDHNKFVGYVCEVTPQYVRLQIPSAKLLHTFSLLSGENSPKQLLLINNQLVTKLIKFFD